MTNTRADVAGRVKNAVENEAESKTPLSSGVFRQKCLKHLANRRVSAFVMTQARSSLTIQRASRLPNIPGDRTLRKWLRAALSKLTPVATSFEITLRIVNAAEGRNLNSAFRGKDYATNVLTFVYHEPSAARLLGDLVLCAPVISLEAKMQSKTLSAHYAHLCVHGVLHLAGHDHESSREAKRMEALEVTILAELGIDDPYRE